MPDASLLASLHEIGFSSVRYYGTEHGNHTGIFELLAGGEVVFAVASQSWLADPAGTDDNLRHAVAQWLRRRRVEA